MTDATINRDVSVLRHLLYWAVDEGLLVSNPLSRLKLVQERRAPKPVLTVGEERRLLKAVPPHLHDLIVVAVDTGMRRGELFHQRWDHVDFTRHLVVVTRSKTIGGEGREIPLTQRALSVLETRPRAGHLVFLYREHGLGTVKTAWKTGLTRAGIRHVRFHDLRHTFNTRLLEAGVLPDVRKALMGHTSGGGVHGQYTHVELPLKRRAIAALDDWWTTQSTELDRTQTPKEEQHESTTEGPKPEDGRAQTLEEKNPG
jgi:integrase